MPGKASGSASGQLHQAVYVARCNGRVVFATQSAMELGAFITAPFEQRTFEVALEECDCGMDNHKSSCVINQASEKSTDDQRTAFLGNIVMFYHKELKRLIKEDQKFWPEFNKSFPGRSVKSNWDGVNV